MPAEKKPLRERIAVFGGSFDPPHDGHKTLLRAALDALRPDRLLLVPAFHSPLKNAPGVDPRARLALLELFVSKSFGARDRRRIAIDPSELHSGGKVYTWRTLQRIAREHPGAELYLVLGSDCINEFHKWQRPALVARLATLTAARRPGARLPRGKKPLRFALLPGTFPPSASSAIKLETLLSGRVPHNVAPAVRAEIERRGLYGLALHRKLRRLLDAGRYRHSLAVAKLCAGLARAHGEDPLRAATAGLLHDCAKRLAPDKRLKLAGKSLPKAELAQLAAHAPCILHAWAGAELAKTEFGVRDEGVLNAIRLHALGARKMTPLEKIAFLADLASEDRTFPGTARLRRLAYSDPDAALALAAKTKLSHLLASGRWIAPGGLELWNRLCERNR